MFNFHDRLYLLCFLAALILPLCFAVPETQAVLSVGLIASGEGLG